MAKPKITYNVTQFTAKSAGTWHTPTPQRGYNVVCCDCSLTHTFDFRVYKGKVQMRAFRDEEATRYMRRLQRREQPLTEAELDQLLSRSKPINHKEAKRHLGVK